MPDGPLQASSPGPDPDKLTYYLLKNVNRAVREFDMISDGDRIAVAVSGGKDSRALLHLLHARRRSAAETYTLLAIHVETEVLGNSSDRSELEPWFQGLGVEYAFVPLDLTAEEELPLSCVRCARNRRKALFIEADRQGCNKLAFGHHFDDAAHTTILNMFYKGRMETLAPTRGFFGGKITLIRPLIYVEERRLTQLGKSLSFPPEKDTCPLNQPSRRAWVKEWLDQAGPDIRQIRANLWRAARDEARF